MACGTLKGRTLRGSCEMHLPGAECGLLCKRCTGTAARVYSGIAGVSRRGLVRESAFGNFQHQFIQGPGTRHWLYGWKRVFCKECSLFGRAGTRPEVWNRDDGLSLHPSAVANRRGRSGAPAAKDPKRGRIGRNRQGYFPRFDAQGTTVTRRTHARVTCRSSVRICEKKAL